MNIPLKATNVDDIDSADPGKNRHADRYSSLAFQDVLSQNLPVMDASGDASRHPA